MTALAPDNRSLGYTAGLDMCAHVVGLADQDYRNTYHVAEPRCL